MLAAAWGFACGLTYVSFFSEFGTLDPIVFSEDEGIRADTTADKLSALKPLMPNGFEALGASYRIDSGNVDLYTVNGNISCDADAIRWGYTSATFSD